MSGLRPVRLCQIASYMSYYQLKGRAYTILSPTDGVRYLLANGIPVIASQRLSLDEPIGLEDLQALINVRLVVHKGVVIRTEGEGE